jgi:hypothetical protein
VQPARHEARESQAAKRLAILEMPTLTVNAMTRTNKHRSKMEIDQ